MGKGLIIDSLLVQNKELKNEENIRITQDGVFHINSKDVRSNIKDSFNINTNGNQKYYTKNGNIELIAENSDMTLRNGKLKMDNSFLYNYNSDSESESDIEPKIEILDNVDVLKLRDESFLIENLNTDKMLTLYSNNRINNISHNNIQNITDKNFEVQATNINLVSMGFITLNSDRVISHIQNDISVSSTEGNIELGINNHGNPLLKIGSNNFVSLSKKEPATRYLDIEVSESENQYNQYNQYNKLKNGINIHSKKYYEIDSTKSQIYDLDIINPDIQLENMYSNTCLNIGLGKNEKENQHRIIAERKPLIDTQYSESYYLRPLNNFSFNKLDIGNKIIWNNKLLYNNVIINVINHITHGTIALIEMNEKIEFDYEIGYIDRNQFGYLRTKYNSYLHLGTNDKNIVTITNTGNVGINNPEPDASFEINNNYGKFFYNKLEKTKEYFNSKTLQFINGNILLVSNSKNGKLYNLEGFIYNHNFQLLKNFLILEKSEIQIEYSIDNIKLEDNSLKYDHCVIVYSFKNTKVYTQSKIFESNGNILPNVKFELEHGDLNKSTCPTVKSFYFNNLDLNGYIIVYRDITDDGLEHNFIQIIENRSNSRILGNTSFNCTKDLYSPDGFTEEKIRPEAFILNYSGYSGIEIDDNSNSFLITNYHQINVTGNILHKTFLQRFSLGITDLNYIITRKNINNLKILLITPENNEYIRGTFIKRTLISKSIQTYLCSYYSINKLNKKSVGMIELNLEKDNDNLSKNESFSFYESDSEWDIDLNDNIDDNIDDIPMGLRSDNNKYILTWTQKIKNKETIFLKKQGEKTITFENGTNSSILCIKNLKDIYKECILSFNCTDTDNKLYNKSVKFRSVFTNSKLVTIKNKNINFDISNEGDVNISNEGDVNINNLKITTDGNLVLTPKNSISSIEQGENGQINFKDDDNNLYIYLNNKWRKIETSIVS